MRKATIRDISYSTPYHRTITIPAGTLVRPATNLPDTYPAQYWVDSWPGMDETAESWHRNYGFLVDENDVIPIDNATTTMFCFQLSTWKQACNQDVSDYTETIHEQAIAPLTWKQRAHIFLNL